MDSKMSLGAESELARLFEIIATKSFQKGDFTLSSGLKSNFYLDMKPTTLDPEGAWLVGRVLYRVMAGKNWGGVGGLTLGADPMATAVSVASYEFAHPIPAFIVRKEAKGHGTSQRVEGLAGLHRNYPIAVVEDVVTTGKSSLQAIEALRECGLKVEDVFALVDRNQGGREALEKAGVKLHAVFNVEQFLSLK